MSDRLIRAGVRELLSTGDVEAIPFDMAVALRNLLEQRLGVGVGSTVYVVERVWDDPSDSDNTLIMIFSTLEDAWASAAHEALVLASDWDEEDVGGQEGRECQAELEDLFRQRAWESVVDEFHLSQDGVLGEQIYTIRVFQQVVRPRSRP